MIFLESKCITRPNRGCVEHNRLGDCCEGSSLILRRSVCSRQDSGDLCRRQGCSLCGRLDVSDSCEPSLHQDSRVFDTRSDLDVMALQMECRLPLSLLSPQHDRLRLFRDEFKMILTHPEGDPLQRLVYLCSSSSDVVAFATSARSSAYASSLIPLGMSSLSTSSYAMFQSAGPKTLPCDTPADILYLRPPSVIHLFCRYDEITRLRYGETRLRSRAPMMTLHSTELKAFLTSSSTSATILLLLASFPLRFSSSYSSITP